MNRRAELLDLECQVEDRDREEHRSALHYDRRHYVRISGQPFDADRVPDRADVEDLEEPR